MHNWKPNIRIIPRLDIKGPNLVKGIHLEGLRVLGKPWDFASRYYHDHADELIYMDVVASLYGRNNLLDIVQKTAERIFIPLTVGGGVRRLDDIRKLLRAGADKVAINTAAIHNPNFISEAANAFGSQCIVISIEAKKMKHQYEALTDNGRELTGKSVCKWAKHASELGAGEILLTSIDNEGTGNGFDTGLTHAIATSVPIPVIACGGAGNPNHIQDVISKGKADAISAASIFHYHRIDRLQKEIDFQDEGNIEFITQRRGSIEFLPQKMQTTAIPDLKKTLFYSDGSAMDRNVA